MQTQEVHLRVGYELAYDCPQPVPMILMVSIHHSRASDIVVAERIETEPFVPITSYRDAFGNWCSRLTAPAGKLSIRSDGVVRDSGEADAYVPYAIQHPIEDLPSDSLMFLLGSRYCETDLLSNTAWQLFQYTTPGWSRVQAICDYVHNHIFFDYQNARATRTASEAYHERTGVCRDFAHLAITFCRCMNIPARYCTGYLSDVGETPPFGIADFAAWFQAYIGGEWHTFDPRNNTRRRGRILMAQGRDAADVAIATTFGPNFLEGFKVWTDEIPPMNR